MRKIVKWLLIWVGLAVVLASFGLLFWDNVQINNLWELAVLSDQDPANPMTWILLSSGTALVGGVILGCGIGLPRRGYKQGVKASAAPVPLAPQVAPAVKAPPAPPPPPQTPVVAQPQPVRPTAPISPISGEEESGYDSLYR